MLVALHRQHDFFAREIFLDRGGRRWLRLVPLAVVFWCGMDVMRGGIVILDLYGLTGHHTQDVRVIFAAALIQNDWVFGDVKRSVPETILYVHKHIGEVSTRDGNVFRFVRPLARGLLAHVD